MSENENLSLEVFDSPEFGQMRILREGDKYLFCANDAAVALGYSNPRAALQRHCKGVAKRDTLTPGGVQSLSYIPEGDLYRLIIHSKLPSAEMIQQYDEEQILLENRIEELESLAQQDEIKQADTSRFIALVKKYRDCEELTDTMLYAFIDRIEVHEATGGRTIYRQQKIDIYFNFIGNYYPPVETISEEERIAAINHSPRKRSWRRKASGWRNSIRFWTWTAKITILSATAKTGMTQTGLLYWTIFTAASRKCRPIGGQNPVDWRNGHERKRSDASLPGEQSGAGHHSPENAGGGRPQHGCLPAQDGHGRLLHPA